MKLSAAAAYAATWASLLSLACGTPTVSFPINAQLPPVARIDQPFSFIFADNTFTSSSSSITYSLDNPPDWLSIDSSQRWLHGTPQESDVSSGDIVGIPVSLVATDGDGSTSLNVTLVVARTDAPTVKIPIGQQLADSGYPYSEPSSLLSYPSASFNFSFSQSTFSSSGLNYYAVSGDNSPLPSWVSFDAGRIAFSGTTPPADSLIEPPQTFSLQLVASDVTGFSAASVAFSIVVGSHTITVEDPSVVLNATVGTALNYTGLQTGVKVDGRVAGPANLSATVLSGQSLPDWLSFDNATWLLSGTPPSSAQNTAFSISFSDALADTVNVTFQVDLNENGTVFRSMLPSMQAERGEQFSLDLEPYLKQKSGIDVTLQTEPTADWLRCDNSSLTISGTVPISETASSISVSVRAMHERTNTFESETFMLQILSGSNSTGDSTVPTTSATNTNSATTTAAAASGGNSVSTRTILLAVLIPTLLLALVVAIVACCMCYRRVRQKKEQQQVMHWKVHGISDPVPLSFAYNGQDNAVSSMRALNKVYKIGNRKDAYAKPPEIQIVKPSPQIDEKRYSVPAGTALTTDIDGLTAEKTTESLRVVGVNSPMVGSPLGTIPDFPAPPGQRQSSSPRSSAASAAGNSHEQDSVAVAAAAGRAQWPFGASTEPSSESGQSQRDSGPDRSVVDDSHLSQTRSDVGDALGIYSINSGDGTNGLSSLDANHSVPSQRALVEEFNGSAGSRSAASIARPIAAATTAASLEMAGAAGSDGGDDRDNGNVGDDAAHARDSRASGSARGGSPTSNVADADGSWATLYSNGNDNIERHGHGYSHSAADVEKGMAGPSVDENGSAQPAQTGFLSGFAARIASRFRTFKKQPAPVDVHAETSSAAQTAGAGDGTRGIPSSDVASFDTDFGSVRIDSVTTAQPYRPKPVFISRDNRISEEPSQLSSRASRSTNNSNNNLRSASGDDQQVARLSDTKTPKELRLQAYHEGGAVGAGEDLSSDEVSSHDEEEDVGSDEEGDRAIRVDPPRPVLFIAPLRAERDALSLHSSLSYEIASSLGSRSRHRSQQKLQQQLQHQSQQQPSWQGRPTSAMSGLSGISAAIEEVRSLLLLPESSAAVSVSSLQHQQSRGTTAAAGTHTNGQQSTSSTESWETLESNEPNWRSLCNFVLPPTELNAPPRPMGRTPFFPLQTQAQAAAVAGAAAQASQASQPTLPDQPPQSFYSAQSTQSTDSTPPSRGFEHPAHAAFVFPMRAQSPDEAQANEAGRDDDDGYEDVYDEDEDEDDYDDEEGEELILSERYRPTSSFYADAFDHAAYGGGDISHSTGEDSMAHSNPVSDEQQHDNDAAFPAPYIVDSSDSGGSVHRYGGPDDDSGGEHGEASGSRGGGVGGVAQRPSSIGLAVSKYSQPQLLGTQATQASLVSTVSSGGIKVFI